MLKIIHHPNLLNRYNFGRKKNVDFVRERENRDSNFLNQIQYQYRYHPDNADSLTISMTI